MNYIDLLHESQMSINNARLAFLQQLKIDDADELKTTIKKLFQKYGKGDEQINTLLSEEKNISKIRCAHIIYTFLLGCYIYQQCSNLRKKIEQKTKELLNKAGHDHDFAFIWFLITLFHDLGYAEEDKGRKSRFGKTMASKLKLEQIDGVPSLYKKVYLDYFCYIKKVHKKTDHGIYAGLTMYKILCDINRIKEWDEGIERLEPLYNLVSWVVLAHNIWFVKDNDIEKCKTYHKYHLEQLILKTKTDNGQIDIVDYPIKLSQYPLLFLFCLVDLIEPMKRIGCMDCYDKIDFRITKNKLIIKTNLDCNSGQEYIKNITSANDWLTITERNNNTVTLSLA